MYPSITTTSLRTTTVHLLRPPPKNEFSYSFRHLRYPSTPYVHGTACTSPASNYSLLYVRKYCTSSTPHRPSGICSTSLPPEIYLVDWTTIFRHFHIIHRDIIPLCTIISHTYRHIKSRNKYQGKERKLNERKLIHFWRLGLVIFANLG
jgi:hypothetical protein